MAEFRMPSLGSGMEQGTLVEWLKKPGERITPGDIIAVIETEKGAIEVEAFEGGTFARALIELGATVPVGTPIAMIDGAPGTAPPAAAPAAAAPPRLEPVRAPVPPAPPPPSPAKREAAPGLKISPAARKLAEERRIDLAAIKGTGPEGSIVYVDVENAAPKPAAKKAKPGADTAAMRTIIAAATARSKREIPHYYLMHDVDITDMAAWLAARNAARTPDQRVLPAAIFLKALAMSAREHPGFNGFYVEDGFRSSDAVHVGVAIAVRGGGLVAPAIHDVDKLSLDEVMQRLRDLVGRVRAGRFRSSELSDPTITLTNLGDRGVDGVIPVIYPPQVAIAGVGTPRERPWIVNGKVEVRQIVTLSLAADHRASNGHQGALFLSAWSERVQRPEQL